ncbi:DUF2497 domain-containing protein [Litorimonas sp. RW-G-Af-16]|uniref:DUF2497 domain-containing protein n=1 Tax=Litorimonas sp. RW-G-Af-16 TaxID=3241168 RepID=UPI003AAD15E0
MAELVTDDEAEQDAPSDNEDEADLDLVKSLMADLSDDEAADDMMLDDAALEIPELDDSEDAGDDILDEILDMTLEDELSAHDAPLPDVDSVAAMELENTALNEASPSLSDIAAAAEDAAGGGAGFGKANLTNVAAFGAVAATGAAFAAQDTVSGAPDATDVTPTTLTNESTPKETAKMARTAKKDTIMDDVTETATADVFASLNRVVEEQAVTAERGDRIGDLVMEALRPMLKDWLDANLKGIVERAVTKEVKRIASGK